MKIALKKDYYFYSDSKNYIISKISTQKEKIRNPATNEMEETGKMIDVPVSPKYYSTFEFAIEGLKDIYIKESDAESFEALARDIGEIKNYINEIRLTLKLNPKGK